MTPPPPPPPIKGGEGTHSPAGEGGGSQFGRLEKKLSPLSTLWCRCFRIILVLVRRWQNQKDFFTILMKEMYIAKASLVQNVSPGTVSTEFAYWRKFHSINIYMVSICIVCINLGLVLARAWIACVHSPPAILLLPKLEAQTEQNRIEENIFIYSIDCYIIYAQREK